MGYRKYNYRKSRQKRSYSRSREYQPGLAESLGRYLANLIAAFVKWIIRAVGRFLGRAAKPLPQAVTSATAERYRSPNFRGLPYRKVPRLVTEGETGVWYSLHKAVEGKYRLFCKVRLADVVYCPGDGWYEHHWFKKIGRYHVDFVICDPKTTAPLLVVELDDRRHRQHVRKRHDDFKDAILRDAGLPIYRIAAQAAYDPEELKMQIEKRIGQRI